MENNNVVLDVRNVSIFIKNKFLLKNISFSLEKSECWGIIGANHTGKSSLIKAISGALPITEGQVVINGKDIKLFPEILQKVGVCLDPPVFFKYQTVFENIKYLASLSGITDKEEILNILEKFDLKDKTKTRVYSLSYYEKKLMSLALAFLIKPVLLLLDEPYKSLSPTQIEKTRRLITDVREEGTTVIISSENIESIEYDCNKFIFMDNKKIKDILNSDQCDRHCKNKKYAFLKIKHTHFVSRLIQNNFDVKVKILDNRIVFEANEELLADIISFLTKFKINIHKMGYITKKSETIMAAMTPYFMEEA